MCSSSSVMPKTSVALVPPSSMLRISVPYAAYQRTVCCVSCELSCLPLSATELDAILLGLSLLLIVSQ